MLDAKHLNDKQKEADITSSAPLAPLSEHRWTVQEIALFMPWAMQLFNKESELYLVSSFENEVLRADPEEHELAQFHHVLFSYLNSDKEKSAKVLRETLDDSLKNFSRVKIMICWGALIKTSLKQAEIIDLGDSNVKKYHDYFIKKLSLIAQKSDEKSKKLIGPCFEKFFQKLEENGHPQSAVILRTYLKLYSQISNEWLPPMAHNYEQLYRSLGVYLGPGLLYGLKLNSRLITKAKDKSAATLEFMFMQRCSMALLSKDDLYKDIEELPTKVNALAIGESSKAESSELSASKTKQRARSVSSQEEQTDIVSYNPLYGADLSRLKNVRLSAIFDKSATNDTEGSNRLKKSFN